MDTPERADEAIPELTRIAAKVRDDGVTDVLLVGMGGSSLYPLVLDLRVDPGWPRLRVLHSTGQLHEGGPDNGTFPVAVGDDPEDAEVAGQDYGFPRLKRAQAAGDIVAPRDAGRTVAHMTLEHLTEL